MEYRGLRISLPQCITLHILHDLVEVKVKVNQYRYGPGVVQKVPGS